MDKANTPEEIVDVVDINDQVVGSALRKEVNSNPGLIHREVAVLVFDDQGRVLMQQRSRNKKVMPLYWIISVAGHIPANTSPEDSAHRELQEELGFDTKLVFYTKLLLHYPNETHFAYGYLGEIPTGTIPQMDPAETEQLKFVTASQLEEMVQQGELIEEYSLADFRAFFAGKYHHLVNKI